MKLRLINDLYPTVILVIVVVLLAGVIIYNSNRNQREVIETVKQAIRAREEHDAQERMEAMIKANMQDPEQWQKAKAIMRPD